MNTDTVGEPWVGIDLDGTLAEYHGFKGVYHIGRPVQPMIERVKRWVDVGYRVQTEDGMRGRGEGEIITVRKFKIFTARMTQGDGETNRRVCAAIQDWLECYGLPRLEVTCRKDLACLEIWDDRAVRIACNEGYRCY